jgi:hypothetical protein
MKIKFNEFNCNIVFDKYQNNNRIAVMLKDVIDNDVVAFASVNLPFEPLENDEVAIKTYSENEGMLKCLIENKVVSQPVRYSKEHGIPICKLLINTSNE